MGETGTLEIATYSIPSFSITRCERRLSTLVKETICPSPQRSKPQSIEARAASTANPSPQRAGRTDQPTSATGSPSISAALSPIMPTSSPPARSRHGHQLNPRSRC